jgi:hypothetical protein
VSSGRSGSYSSVLVLTIGTIVELQEPQGPSAEAVNYQISLLLGVPLTKNVFRPCFGSILAGKAAAVAAAVAVDALRPAMQCNKREGGGLFRLEKIPHWSAIQQA